LLISRNKEELKVNWMKEKGYEEWSK